MASGKGKGRDKGMGNPYPPSNGPIPYPFRLPPPLAIPFPPHSFPPYPIIPPILDGIDGEWEWNGMGSAVRSMNVESCYLAK